MKYVLILHGALLCSLKEFILYRSYFKLVWQSESEASLIRPYKNRYIKIFDFDIKSEFLYNKKSMK